MTLPTRHLLSVWNPSYAANAMEAHLGVLLGRIQAWRDQAAGDDDVYVWWGKIRSENRQQGMARAAELEQLGKELDDDDDRELQLYLTDYRSLYVADVVEITSVEVAESDAGHVPAYYRQPDIHCDCWFKLRDIRRLVLDDTIGVVQELRLLRNTHYHDRPVSIYGGMVDLPLVVTRPDGRSYFDPAAYAPLPEGKYWAEFDAEAGGTGLMQRELRENLFGDAAWQALDPVARTFVATAEKVFRDHRGDDAFDFQAVLGPLAKAVEVQVNSLLRAAVRNAPQAIRHVNIDGASVDVATHGSFSLGQLARVIGGGRELAQHLGARLENGSWFSGQLPLVLDDLAKARNPGSHAARVTRDAAQRWRDRLVGVGCQGVLVELGRCRLKSA